MNIRRAKVQEARALSELALRSKAHWGYDAQFIARCRRELTVAPAEIEANPTFVVEDDGAVLGFYAVEHVALDRMELNFLFVEPAAIGRGYGRALIEHAKCFARDLGALTLEIQGDPNAARFYRSAGARQVGVRPSTSVAGRLLPLFEVDLREAEPEGDTSMVRQTISGWGALVALVVGLSAAACGDDNKNEGACKNGTPSCAGATFDEKTCTCGPVVDAGAAIDAAAATSCAMPLAAQEAGAGVVACNVERAYVQCGGCSCLSEDPRTCAGCGAGTCTNQCQANEYAVSCGGLPRRDGGSYAEAPASCRSVAHLPSGTSISCCSCL